MPSTRTDRPSTEVLRYAAFTDRGRGGNPAGVVLDARGLTDGQMLAVAAEVGFSETAFVTGGDTEEDLTVRYFSPLAEVPFCGHATVATAVALADRLGPGRLLMSTPAGPVPVRTAAGPDGITATLTSPPASTRPADPATVARALGALRWDRPTSTRRTRCTWRPPAPATSSSRRAPPPGSPTSTTTTPRCNG